MLANATEMLKKAKENKYAIAHFNINNLEWTRFILEEVEANQSPVILGVSEGAAKYMGGFYTVSCLVRALMYDLKTTVPVALHLDHGSSVESCYAAIDAGFTSVMIDASKYSLEENIRMTKEVVHYAHSKGVSVEAEVGHIGGSEDNVSSSVAYCEVADAVELAQTTGIDFFAPALGSVHGIYKGEPKLDFDRMQEIAKLTNLPLVLHGGSGIPDEMIQKGIACGICKLNINTDLQIVWSKAVREFLQENESVYDPRKIIKAGEQALKEEVRKKLELLGSMQKA
ncbi:MAG TPA: class II fructose-1,6-bisphosphate aldolase [Candidatus Fimihabitans intestinipullorum]|uniref:Class II fructose-1,6-bisphosphate aldolase n=1 Tax=Candidatus Fimihabitans intestinipullorum TaxID=2840820 RepID=A0A9D1L2T8_9BACT|nr:class II fructose-1,6-bisphosphate aldolase [Candidatus Fimihabitans intestinipullorum]